MKILQFTEQIVTIFVHQFWNDRRFVLKKMKKKICEEIIDFEVLSLIMSKSVYSNGSYRDILQLIKISKRVFNHGLTGHFLILNLSKSMSTVKNVKNSISTLLSSKKLKKHTFPHVHYS